MDELDLDAMRARLREALERQRRTMRDVSVDAGLSASYLRNILLREQVPSVDKLHAIAKTLDVSLPWLVYGVNVPPDAQEIFDLMEKNPAKFQAVLALVRDQ